MHSVPSANIFDIKKYAIHDGPGIRTTVFLKGCPLSCRWCHNPEGLENAPNIVYDIKRCIGCGDCMEVCPHKAISSTDEGMSTDDRLCRMCGACIEACPGCARETVVKKITVEQLLDTIKQDVLFYDESGGGVTFSGGEPLLQPEFLIEMLEACADHDIHRVVDTSGYTSRATLEAVAKRTDMFLYDLKHIDEKRHREFTGVSNQIILDNLKYLHQLGANITVRIPLIPGVNDDADSLSQMCGFLKSLNNIHDIDILPYHDYQKNKYRKLGMPTPEDNINKPTREKITMCLKHFSENGFKVSLGG